MWRWIETVWMKFYEGQTFRSLPPPYKLNPCDSGAARWVKPLGPEFENWAIPCQCCSGMRVVVALALGAVLPGLVTAAVLAAWGAYALARTAWAVLTSKD